MSHRYDDQNFSRNERDRDRERHRHGDEEYNEYSQQFGQREPYSSSASNYAHERDFPRGYHPEEHSRDAGRGDWNSRPEESRYSESQYGQRRFTRDRYQPQPEGRSTRGGHGSEQSGYRGPRGYAPPADDWRRSRAFGVGYSGTGDNFAAPGNRGSYEQLGRYDTQAPGGVGYSGQQRFGEEVFGSPDQPSYFGTGNYGDGGVRFGGGYGEERSRWSSSGYGQYQGPERSGHSPGGAYPESRGSSHSSSHGGSHADEHRPGLLSRLFHRGPKGYQRSDERLKEDISERLIQAGHIDSSDVSITVASGVVTLEGTVPDRYMKHNIEDLVDACHGVQDIDNRIRVNRGYGGGTSTTSTASNSSATTGTASSGSAVAGTAAAGLSGASGGTNGKRKDS